MGGMNLVKVSLVYMENYWLIIDMITEYENIIFK